MLDKSRRRWHAHGQGLQHTAASVLCRHHPTSRLARVWPASVREQQRPARSSQSAAETYLPRYQRSPAARPVSQTTTVTSCDGACVQITSAQSDLGEASMRSVGELSGRSECRVRTGAIFLTSEEAEKIESQCSAECQSAECNGTQRFDPYEARQFSGMEWVSRHVDSGGAGGAAGKIFGGESSQTCQAQAHRVTAAKHDYHDDVRVCATLGCGQQCVIVDAWNAKRQAFC